MSLSSPPPPVPVGIIAAKSLDDLDLLDTVITDEKAAAISHIHTNGCNQLVIRYAQERGIPYTVWPATGAAGHTLKANRQIVEASQFVFIVADPESKNTGHVKAECEKQARKYRIVPFEPIDHWRTKVCKVEEILAAIPAEDVAASSGLKAIQHVL